MSLLYYGAASLLLLLITATPLRNRLDWRNFLTVWLLFSGVGVIGVLLEPGQWLCSLFFPLAAAGFVMSGHRDDWIQGLLKMIPPPGARKAPRSLPGSQPPLNPGPVQLSVTVKAKGPEPPPPPPGAPLSEQLKYEVRKREPGSP